LLAFYSYGLQTQILLPIGDIGVMSVFMNTKERGERVRRHWRSQDGVTGKEDTVTSTCEDPFVPTVSRAEWVKTALPVNLPYAYQQSGKRTLLVDLDPQGAAGFYFRVSPCEMNTTQLDQTLAHGLARLGLGVTIALHGFVRLPNLSGFAAGMQKQFAETFLPGSLV
jgi:hypothetical protein